jgi:hypothetical protein
MTKIATAAASAIALTLAAHASGAYAANIATPSKVSTVTPVVQKSTVPTITPVVQKVTVPATTPVVPKTSQVAPAGAPKAPSFGTGVWQSTVATPVNPVTGLQASAVSRMVFSSNGTFTDYIIAQGGTGLAPGHTGAGGLVIITGKDKVVGSSIQLTETAESICTGLGCMSYPTAAIGKTVTEQVKTVSPGVVTVGGGADWTALQ